MSMFSTVPKTKHFAIILYNSRTIYHEGDERSKTHPGHGYPAWDETIESIDYEHFLKRDEWEKRIKELALQKKNFQAQEVLPVEFELTTTVKTKLL